MAVSTVVRSSLSTFDKFQRTSAGASSTPGLFVTAGGGSIATSSDGITWTTRTSGGASIGLVDRDAISGTWSTFTNNNSAPGGGNWFSTDGTTWTQQFSPPNQRTGRSGYFTEDRQFVDFDTSNRWQRIGNVQLFGGASGSAVVFDKGGAFRNRYIYSANFGGDVFTSVNGGASWLIDDGSITNATQVWATDTQFLVSNSSQILSSANGGTFTSRATAGFTVNGFRRANGLIFAYSGGASTSIMTSPDGITWTTRTIPNMTVRDVVFGAGNWVLVGYNAAGSAGAIATSSDGITWTARTITSSPLESVLFA